MSPTLGRWQVIVIEDADRITERGADALLKSIEEPAPRTVWILCAPTADDVVATIRSRCRLLTLQTPSIAAVARLLETRDGIEPELAAYAARVSQGHIGRARVLARDEGARKRRQQVLQIPFQLHGLGACLAAAAQVVEASTVEAAEATASWTRANGRHWKRPWDSARRGRSRAKPRLRSRSLKNSSALEPSAFSGMRLIEHSPS